MSVVIAAFSSEWLVGLLDAIAAVRAQTAAALETIVVVDGNPALVPTPRWIAELQRGLETPRRSGWRPDWVGRRPRWFPSEFNWVIGCTYTGLPEEPSPVRNLIAANMSVRRDAFEALDGFRADFGKQGERAEPEETELCLRALKRWPDRVWLYRPDAEVSHRVPPRRGARRYFVRRCWHEGVGKARLLHYATKTQALASERRYVRDVLPRGVLRGVGDAVLRRDAAGLGRSTAIVVGLGITVAGYLRGRLATYGTMPRPAQDR